VSPLRSRAATEGGQLDFRTKMERQFTAVAFASKQERLANQLLEVRSQPTKIVAGAWSSSSEINDSNHVIPFHPMPTPLRLLLQVSEFWRWSGSTSSSRN